MYWMRSTSILSLVLYGLMSLEWIFGGWLLVTHAFPLRQRERILAGLATGWVLFVVLTNLLAHELPLPLSFWAAATLILLGGILLAWRTTQLRYWLDWTDLRHWPQLVWLCGLVYLFEIMQRGVAIFDDYLHLPLVSRMAAGDIPPHFYLNSDLRFAYHYGLQVWAASLVRMANFFPWSAWDFSKATAIGFTLLLGWLWARRMVRHAGGAFLGSFLITFGSGAAWLLLLLPISLLMKIQGNIHLVNTAADTANTLVSALSSPWVIEGAGKVPFPFAFQNGIFTPLTLELASTGAMPFMTVLLMLMLLSNRKLTWVGTLITSLLFASLALNAEHLFAFLWAGVGLVLILVLFFKICRPGGEFVPHIWRWAVVLAISAVLSLVQGGFITETARSLLVSLHGGSTGTTNVNGFFIRWPPGIYSTNFGMLSLFNWRQLILLLAELGPALLLLPVAVFVAWRSLKYGSWFTASLGVAALGCFFFNIFFQYGVDPSSVRFTSTALWISLCLSLPVLSLAFRKKNRLVQYGITAGYLITVFGAVVMFAVMLTTTVNPQLSTFIDGTDARFSQLYWNRLGQNARILDWIPERATTIFGRSPKAHSSIYVALPSWSALIANPDPVAVANAGYQYIYMDPIWWNRLHATSQQALQATCVKTVKTIEEKTLLDVSGCR
jgi:hypothetical protein